MDSYSPTYSQSRSSAWPPRCPPSGVSGLTLCGSYLTEGCEVALLLPEHHSTAAQDVSSV